MTMRRVEVKMKSQDDMICSFRRSCTNIYNRINIIVHNFAVNYRYNWSTIFELHTKKSVGAYVYLPPEWSYRAPKIAIFWNIIMFKKREVDLLWGWKLPKIRIISKNASNKSCWALNSLQKSQQAHMSISLQSKTTRLQRLPYFEIL